LFLALNLLGFFSRDRGEEALVRRERRERLRRRRVELQRRAELGEDVAVFFEQAAFFVAFERADAAAPLWTSTPFGGTFPHWTSKTAILWAADSFLSLGRARIFIQTEKAMARSPDYLGAAGIGVRDLKRSADFYARALGMQAVQAFKLGHMDEIVMSHEGRNAIVLMQYKDTSIATKDLPVKLVFYVSDPKAVSARVREAGCEVTREPGPPASFGNTIVGLAKDPDGYTIELLQAPSSRAEKSAA